MGRGWMVGLAAVGAVTLTLAGCGTTDVPPETGAARDERPIAAPGPAPVVGEDVRAPAVPAGVGPALEVAPESARQDLDQPAIWPAPDVVFATPEEAATDFVSAVLISEGDPLLGEFQSGDARSGEIAVLFAGESGDLDPPQQKGLLLLRQIGPTNGWYVIAATSDGVMIDEPKALQRVAAGDVTVAGDGRGFESTLNVRAFPPGDLGATIDQAIGAGGALGDLEPYSVVLDLSGVDDGDVVAIVVRGDTGLGSDPSEFAALPVVIGASPTSTIPETK